MIYDKWDLVANRRASTGSSTKVTFVMTGNFLRYLKKYLPFIIHIICEIFTDELILLIVQNTCVIYIFIQVPENNRISVATPFTSGEGKYPTLYSYRMSSRASVQYVSVGLTNVAHFFIFNIFFHLCEIVMPNH